MSPTTTATMFSSTKEMSGNGSSDYWEIVLEKERRIVINQVIYLSCLSFFGTIANIIIIYRGLRYKSGLARSSNGGRAVMNTTNLLVVSLAISNLGTSTFSVGIYIVPVYLPNLPISDFTCRFVWPVRELFVTVACYSVTFIAVGRYLILFQSFRRLKLFSSPVANNVAVWLGCYFLYAFPYAAAYGPIEINGTRFCDTSWESPAAQRVYITYATIFNMVVPTILVSGSYIGIIRRLKRARNVVAPEIAPDNPSDREMLSIAAHSHRAAKISLLLLFSFIITYVPFGVLALWIEYENLEGDTFPELETLHAVAFCLMHSGAILDPFILMLSSRAYRPSLGFLKTALFRP